MIGEEADVASAVTVALTAEGYRVRLMSPGAGDISRAVTVRERLELHLHRSLTVAAGEPPGLSRRTESIAGVINLLALENKETPLTAAAWTFQVVKEFADDLQASAANGGGWFVNVTALDGHFGLGPLVPMRSMETHLAAAGTLGTVKTLRREYPRLRVKNIDVEPNMPADMLAARLLQELTMEDDLVEVGLTREGRWCPALREEQIECDLAPLTLDQQSVILVTGGARGITAHIARRLAEEARPRLILVGRSPLPEVETPRKAGLDRAGLRKLLLDEARTRGGSMVPAEIERDVNAILRDREIRATLDACTTAGAEVEYHALDVRDGEAFGQLIDSLYERFGRIDGVIHGAGIIDDRRIRDKSLDSFAAVFRTKVDSAWTLARQLRPESLKFLAFFGSVSGRFGNAGQVDYSAANEALNKLADYLHRRWPGRVVCLNWGPWEGGMVSEELRRLYAGAGIELVPVEEGVAAFLAEIRRMDRGGAEVVLARGVERLSILV
ncbi:MAG TPA: SDR family NAD(P)-dependent oxidoreductase [Gemmataceae bacterium]|nr:SDR family NAD(P)-dependent oxidoreductase [Gemmataceae bacterium]